MAPCTRARCHPASEEVLPARRLARARLQANVVLALVEMALQLEATGQVVGPSESWEPPRGQAQEQQQQPQQQQAVPAAPGPSSTTGAARSSSGVGASSSGGAGTSSSGAGPLAVVAKMVNRCALGARYFQARWFSRHYLWHASGCAM